MKKCDFPDRCGPCRLARREDMRRALEGGSDLDSVLAYHKNAKRPNVKFETLLGE